MSDEQQNLFDVQPGHGGHNPIYVPRIYKTRAEIQAMRSVQPGDICANRHGGNAESEEAFRRLAPALPQQRALVLAKIREAGPEGMSCKEVAAALGVGMNVISGRFTELRVALEILAKRGPDGWSLRRDGSKVFVAKGVRT